MSTCNLQVKSYTRICVGCCTDTLEHLDSTVAIDTSVSRWIIFSRFTPYCTCMTEFAVQSKLQPYTFCATSLHVVASTAKPAAYSASRWCRRRPTITRL